MAKKHRVNICNPYTIQGACLTSNMDKDDGNEPPCAGAAPPKSSPLNPPVLWAGWVPPKSRPPRPPPPMPCAGMPPMFGIPGIPDTPGCLGVMRTVDVARVLQGTGLVERTNTVLATFW